MVNAKSAGVTFTIDPISLKSSEVVIESAWGLGEMVVGSHGMVDRFVVEKDTLQILQKRLAPKERMIAPASNGVDFADVPTSLQWSPSLQDDEIKELAGVGKKLENHFGQPQDIEWAIAADQPLPESIIVLQSRLAR